MTAVRYAVAYEGTTPNGRHCWEIIEDREEGQTLAVITLPELCPNLPPELAAERLGAIAEELGYRLTEID